MRKKIAKFFLLFMLVCILCLTASAEVSISHIGVAGDNAVTVIGHKDFYPIEYYNKKTEMYDGVMPSILKQISENTGIDFVYIHKDNKSRSATAEQYKADIVSAYSSDSADALASNTVDAVVYSYLGKTVHIGFAFTDYADGELKELFRSEIEKLSYEEIYGYFIKQSYDNPNSSATSLIIALSVCSALFLSFIIVTAIKLNSAKKQISADRMTDAETGIGNLVSFEYYFERENPYFANGQYYVAYIIIDSGYLQLYHGGITYSDTVKYAAGILSANAKNGELVARITESGFVFAFQSLNMDFAKLRVSEIISKMNVFFESDENRNKPIFYAACYNLNDLDTGCEVLLYNLRRNCTSILGTDEQIVFCNAYDMHNAIEQKELIDSFERGFKNQEFQLYLQFIVDNKSKKVVSAESLSRWHNPDKGILLPGKYIEAMESAGVISELDYYMFEAVCRQLHKWKDTEFDRLSISCNFTRITLSERNFVDRIKEISNKYVFDRNRIIIEITEDAIERNIEDAMQNVLECKKLGLRFALDDLGSGYTALGNLCEYPVDIVKIDRDILNKTNKENGEELFVGIIDLAHSLNLKVVCEGVETEEQNQFVSNTDCDYIQGWYYSKVLSVPDSENYIREKSEKGLIK